MLASLFFVSAHKDSATRHGCALRSACRGVSERQWHASYEPTEAAAETKSFYPCHKTGENTGFSPVSFFHVLHGYVVQTLCFPTCFHPFPTAATLSSTQNAPGFAFFGRFRVRFAVFTLF